jgi:hypothetical protein
MNYLSYSTEGGSTKNRHNFDRVAQRTHPLPDAILRIGLRARATAGQKLATAFARRKVRSPQGSMPANGRGRALKGQVTESATENIPPVPKGAPVRVKRCGKSAPRSEQSDWQGKPHVEQDQIGEEERPAPPLLPGRSLELASNGRPRGMVAARFGGYRNRLTDRAGRHAFWVRS